MRLPHLSPGPFGEPGGSGDHTRTPAPAGQWPTEPLTGARGLRPSAGAMLLPEQRIGMEDAPHYLTLAVADAPVLPGVDARIVSPDLASRTLPVLGRRKGVFAFRGGSHARKERHDDVISFAVGPSAKRRANRRVTGGVTSGSWQQQRRRGRGVRQGAITGTGEVGGRRLTGSRRPGILARRRRPAGRG